MALQQKQALCRNCNRLTLHSRNTYDVPHVFHLLFTVLFCGLWLPIWFLHALLNTSSEPFLCGACGQPEGTSPEDAARRVEQWERRWEVVESTFRTTASGTGSALGFGLSSLRRLAGIVGRAVRQAPSATDHWLYRLAGEDNAIVYRFLQCLAVAAFAGACLLVLVAFVKLIT